MSFMERVNQGESLVSWLNWLTEPPAVCWSVIMGDLSPGPKGVFWTRPEATKLSCARHEQAITWANVDSDVFHHTTSLDDNMLTAKIHIVQFVEYSMLDIDKLTNLQFFSLFMLYLYDSIFSTVLFDIAWIYSTLPNLLNYISRQSFYVGDVCQWVACYFIN